MCKYLILIVLALLITLFSIEGYERSVDYRRSHGPDYGDYMGKRLKKMKRDGYGVPPGKVRYEPNRQHCYTKYNLLPHKDVAFKPVPYGTGCTYLEMSY